jgi:ribulose-5-phosphate 4-epimerase/fuculose-1-phosphate aldolase
MRSSVSSLHPSSGEEPAAQRELRTDLAAAFRWFARLDMVEAVANHFSVAVDPQGTKFLINPCRRHFSRITASSLLLLDAHDTTTLDRPDAPDPTAWYLHARLHAREPRARCILHLHSKYATALACLQDPTLYPIDMNAARFFGRVAIDTAFAGMALSNEEADRQAALLGEDKSVLLMANHGVLVIGAGVAEALDELFYFERAAERLITCYSTGQPLRILSDSIAAATRQQWLEYDGFARDHLNAVKEILDIEEPDYRR